MALLHESARVRQLPAEQLTLRIEATDIPTLGDVKQVNLSAALLLHYSSYCVWHACIPQLLVMFQDTECRSC